MEFKERLQEGLEYQDYVATILGKKGIVISVYSSYKYQQQAESLQQVEIKLDKTYKRSGNLFIEVEEGERKRKVLDESKIYIVGDYDTIYIFATRHLKQYLAERKPSILTANKTVKGFLLNPKDIEKLHIDKIRGLQ